MKKNLILKLVVAFSFVITSIVVTTVCHAASISISAGNSNLTVGSTTTITIRGNDIAGKIGISSSNPNVISISKTTEWLEGTVTLKATAKAAGTARITVTSIDTASLSTGAAVSVSSGININSRNVVVDTRSTNNNLLSLQIEGVSIAPEFNPATTTYTANVNFDVTSINVLATPADNKSTTLINGNMDLVTGQNNVSVVVTAENGSKKTYTIIVTKAKNPDDLDTNLKSLTIQNSNLRDIFDGNRHEYICDDIYADIEKLDILAEAKIDGAKVEIIGNENLQIGTNVITIKVTSKDGSASSEYIILVYKLNEILSLKNIDDQEVSFRSITGIINIVKQNILETILIIIIVLLVIITIILICVKTKYKKIAMEHNSNSNNENINEIDSLSEEETKQKLEDVQEKVDKDEFKRRKNK